MADACTLYGSIVTALKTKRWRWSELAYVYSSARLNQFVGVPPRLPLWLSYVRDSVYVPPSVTRLVPVFAPSCRPSYADLPVDVLIVMLVYGDRDARSAQD